MNKPNGITWVALILLVVGGLNWALVGIFSFDLVKWLFTDTLNLPILARIVYIVVGICAIYILLNTCCCCKNGQDGDMSKQSPPPSQGE